MLSVGICINVGFKTSTYVEILDVPTSPRQTHLILIICQMEHVNPKCPWIWGGPNILTWLSSMTYHPHIIHAWSGYSPFVYHCLSMSMKTWSCQHWIIHSITQQSEHVSCGPKYLMACVQIIHSCHQKNIKLDLIEVIQQGSTPTTLLGRWKFHHLCPLGSFNDLQYWFIWQKLQIKKRIYSLYLTLLCSSPSNLLIYFVESQKPFAIPYIFITKNK